MTAAADDNEQLSLGEYAQRIVDAAPPFSEAKLRRIAALLYGPTAEQPDRERGEERPEGAP